MSRKGENIYKRKDGRWEGRYIKTRTIDGKIKYGYIYAKTYKEVKLLLKEAPKEMSSDTFLRLQKKESDFVCILAERWFESVRPQVKESTAMKYRNALDNYINPYLGNLPVDQITYERVSSYYNILIMRGGKTGKGLSPKTAADNLTILRSILRHASRNGHQVSPDAFAVQVKSKAPDMRILSRTEQKRLSDYLIQYPSLPNLGILICLYTGIRIGELCALRWEDILLEERTLYIHKTMLRIQNHDTSIKKTKIIITEPKSHTSTRYIPLQSHLINLLNHCENKKGYLLTGSNTHYIEPRSMQNHFKKVIRNCEISDANFHALRHTFATRCVELGFDTKTLSEILGHANVNITLNRYVHPTMAHKRENMEKLSLL